MPNPKNPTRSIGEAEVVRSWYVADAADQVLGRFASHLATILRGKHKPTYTPHVDGGDFVVVVNAKNVRLTGRKLEQKEYVRHSGTPGGLRTVTARAHARDPPRPRPARGREGHAAEGSARPADADQAQDLPRRDHPHAAQTPAPLEIR